MYLLFSFVLLAWPRVTVAQQIFYNPNDERFKSLYLEKAESDYKVRKDEFSRQQKLYEKGLISEQDFRASENSFKNAQITYQQAILSLAFDQPHVTIDKAIKYQSKGGKKRVRITLRNTTGGLLEGRRVQLQDFEGIRTDQITNVYVSLLNDQHSIVSQPYETKIPRMPYNEPVIVDFLLLQDLDNVTVKSLYGDKSEEKRILLQKDESANTVLMTSEQFSQEVDLGARAIFDLTLELFSSTTNAYKMQTFNLPTQIAYDFLEAQTNARLSQVRFSQDVNTRKLSLAVYLPDRYDTTSDSALVGPSFIIDHPISFIAAAIPQEQVGTFSDGERKYTTGELDRLGVSYIKLELVPRGVGRIQVRATNFYQELVIGNATQMTLTIYNDGTRRLDNIKVRVDAPLNWQSSVAPDLISSLMPGKEEIVAVKLTPLTDIEVGDYEATIKTESFANNRRVESEDKKMRIHVSANANIFGTGALVLLLVGILGSVVWFGLRLSRR